MRSRKWASCARLTWVLTTLALGVVATEPGARAHAGSREQLALINVRIAEDPSNPELYLKRGRIYFEDQHWDPALAEYEHAVDLGLDADIADLARGELFLEAQWPKAAKRFFDRLLARRGDHARAFLLRARAHAALGNPQQAADDYSRALDKSSGASPDLYLEVVRGLAVASRADHAIRRVDEARERFGPIASLVHEAIELEIAAGRFDSALARLDEIAAKPGFRERWMLRRSEVLELAGRPTEARSAYQEARAALMARPAHRRDTPAMRGVAQKIEDGLERLAADE